MRIILILLLISSLFSQNKLKLVTDIWFTNQNYNLSDVKRSLKYSIIADNEKEFIYKTAIKYKLNYKLILTVMEKEFSFISNPKIKNKNIVMGCALHRFKRTTKGKIYVYNTFEKQIENGARILRKWFDYYYKGIEKRIYTDKSNEIIKPENAGTYSLYMYTPHYYATSKYGCKAGGYIALNKIIKRIK